MTDFDYDVIYIGSGHGANHGALKLVQQGQKIAFVEADKLGGTCTNYGCDAKLLLDGPFQVLEDVTNYQEAGLVGQPNLDWEQLMASKHAMIDGFPAVLDQIFAKAGINLYRGRGRLLDAHTVEVNNEKLTTKNIVLATGLRDSTLPVPGHEFIHTSKDFLDLPTLPESMIFIGAGVISMEFASMMVKAGVQVTVVEFGDRALTNVPASYASKIVAKLEDEGVHFHFNEAVSQVAEQDGHFTVSTQSGLTFEAAYVFGATGRVANVENLGLEELGIEAGPKGIVVDDHLRTAVPNIYASGDVVEKSIPKLTPTAAFESNYLAKVLSGDDQPLVYPAVPFTVYTLPRISTLGVSLDQAEADPETYNTKTAPYGQSFDTKRDLKAEVTLVYRKADQTVVGAVIYGNDAASLINILTFVVDKGLKTTDLEQMIFGFPDVTYNMLNKI
ncbi:dihydrolipoyl dehydrogenase family protein [Fructobacillus ficulneus]|uniref:Glutathione reductase n=1 Tax=Fructobacillus ficulneus TaxID=157463 RepID=A0A0K8MGF0_9LACO|nr:NAD(P)/FAD-dependent oxidoreductase [Fructobacillus ficulneus]GAO99610.1 glutathione reductase [Fructobacillus ficulneus]